MAATLSDVQASFSKLVEAIHGKITAQNNVIADQNGKLADLAAQMADLKTQLAAKADDSLAFDALKSNIDAVVAELNTSPAA